MLFVEDILRQLSKSVKWQDSHRFKSIVVIKFLKNQLTVWLVKQ